MRRSIDTSEPAVLQCQDSCKKLELRCRLLKPCLFSCFAQQGTVESSCFSFRGSWHFHLCVHFAIMSSRGSGWSFSGYQMYHTGLIIISVLALEISSHLSIRINLDSNYMSSCFPIYL